MPRATARLFPTLLTSARRPTTQSTPLSLLHRASSIHSSPSRSVTLAPPYRVSQKTNSLHFFPYQSARFRSDTMSPVLTVEEAKKQAAIKAVEDHFDPNARYVGIGSGTTIVYVVEAIKAKSTNPTIQFVPTGYQSRQVIVEAGLTPIAFDSLPPNEVLDVAFDGADEVDDELNCIKGGGACLFQEKLVAERAKKFVCVADYRKAQSRLLTQWPSVPIEVAPLAAHTVAQELRRLGSTNPIVRTHTLAKTGPVKTDQDFFIIDAPFKKLLTESDVASGVKGNGEDGVWEVQALSKKIKSITGVLEVGIFSGRNGEEAQKQGGWGGQKPVAVYFGMQDGSVTVRHANK